MTVQLHPAKCALLPPANQQRKAGRLRPQQQDSATFSIDSHGKVTASPVGPQDEPAPVGRVRFAADPVAKVFYIDNLADMSDDAVKDMYLTRGELLETRKGVRAIIASCLHHPTTEAHKSLDSAFLKVIRHGWRTARRSSDDDTAFDAVMDNAQGELTPSIEDLVAFWEGDEYSNRGLEKLCSPEQKRRRLQFTKTCRDQWITDNNGKANPFHLECSRSLALFARVVAFADEMAAREIYGESESQ